MRRMMLAGLLMMIAAAGARAAEPAEAVDPAAFDAILKQTVRDERVDYNVIRKNHLAALNDYLDKLAGVDPAKLAEKDRLAFYINLYNATMIGAVLDRQHGGYSPEEKDYEVFKTPLVRLKGEKISLNDLENKIIRPTFKDPRIHVALVCGAQSCPPLQPRAYRGADLDKMLDENMRRFLTDPARNQIVDAKKELRLSRIFDWYADDFGGKEKVAAYVSQWIGKDVSDYKVSFLDYSWALNDTDAK